MRRIAAAALGVLLLLPAAAEARMHAPYRGHRIQGTVGAPLDGLTLPSSAYSLRRLRSAYTANKAIRLLRASDSAQQDIGFLGFVPGSGAPLDYAQAGAFCAATTCKVHTWYDQVGSRNLTRSDGLFPAWSQACAGINGGACIATSVTGAYQILSWPGTYTPTMPTTFAAVGRRVSSGECHLLRHFPANTLKAATTNQWQLLATGNITATAADNVWHAGIGTLNGASSVLRIDATETTGTVTGGTAAVTDQYSAIFVADTGSVCNEVEAIIWDGYAATAGERAALAANQKSFWGF